MAGVVLVRCLVVVVKVSEVRDSSVVVVVRLVVGGGKVEVAMDEDRKMVVAVAALQETMIRMKVMVIDTWK